MAYNKFGNSLYVVQPHKKNKYIKNNKTNKQTTYQVKTFSKT